MGLEGDIFDSNIDKNYQASNKEKLYWVVVFNNNINTFEEVASIIKKATICSSEVAEHIVREINNKGESTVMIASYEMARAAADLISSIGIKVKIKKATTSTK